MLVVTQEFEHQDDPINEADFAATLEARRNGEGNSLALAAACPALASGIR